MLQPREGVSGTSGQSLGQGEAFLTDLVKEVGGTIWWDEALRAAIVMLNGRCKGYLASEHKIIEGRTVIRREDFERDVMVYFLGVVPPRVQGVRVLDRKETEATVAWFTDIPANSWVAIDSRAYGANDSTHMHTVLVTGLEKGRPHQAQIRCKALDDAPVATQSVTFSTYGLPQPVISNVQVLDVGETQATVSWSTDKTLQGWVTIGAQRFDEDTRGTFHKVRVTGLERGKFYTAQIHSQIRDDAPVATQAVTFSTYGMPQPTLSNIQVMDVGETQVTITWTTDKWATSQVTLDSRTFGDDQLCTFHKVLVTGLEPGKSYTAQLRSQARDDAPAGLQPVSFTTYGVPKTTLSNVQVIDVGETQVTIAWRTDRPATSQVTLGSKTFGEERLSTFHKVIVNGLEPGRSYSVQLRSQSRGDIPATTQPVNFATNGLPRPSISNVQVVDLEDTKVTILWLTNIKATSQVTLGTQTFGEDRLSTYHKVVVTGLEPGKAYSAQVRGQARADAPMVSQPVSFSTRASVTPVPPKPPMIHGVQVVDVEETEATFLWLTDIPSDSRVTVGSKVYDGNEIATFHSVRVTGLERGKTHAAQLRSQAAGGEQASTFSSGVTTYGMPRPNISSVQVVDVGETQATLAWLTDKPATSEVVVGTKAFGDESLCAFHGVLLTGLEKGQPHVAQIRSSCRSDAPAATQQVSFSTYGSPAPTLSSLQVVDVGETQATFTWQTNIPASSWVTIGSKTFGEERICTVHRVLVTGLERGKSYAAQVLSQVREDAPATTQSITFNTFGLPLPVISSMQVLDVGESQATLTWRTNIPANAQVLIGDKTFGEDTLATFHKVRVTGLEPGKSHTAQLRSRARNDASFATQTVTFSTSGLPQPSVSNIQVVDAGETQATIVWRTNVKTRSRVVIGDQTFGDDRLSTIHKLIMTGLQPGKSYTAELHSQVRDETPTTVVPVPFSTPGVPHPTISNIQVVDVGETQATFIWTTDRQASSWVVIGNQTHGESNRTTFHKVVVTGLEPGKPYTAQLRSQVREKAPVTTHALSLATIGATTEPTPAPAPEVPNLYDGSKPAPGTTNTERWVPENAPLRANPSQWSRALYDQLINQFAVEVNPRYQKGDGKTWCNIFAWDVTRTMGVEVPHWVDAAGNPVGVGQGKETLANDMNRWLHSYGVKQGWRQVDANEAQRLANEGCPVIASQVDSSGGHIGVVRPGELTGNGPASAQAGGTNFNQGHVYDSFSRESAEFWVNDRRTAAGPPPPQPTQKPGTIDVDSLGRLSARYESNGDPACVSSGKGDPGGISYGLYQFSTSQGSARSFINWLQKSHPEYSKDFEGLTAGTQRFGEAWKAVAARDSAGFRQAQHEFIANEFYKKGKELTEAALKGLDFDTRTQTLNDVLWSTAVQHGPSKKGVVNIFQLALAGRNPSPVSDEELIEAVYAERGRKDDQGTLVHFTSSSAEVQKSVAQRFRDELADALASVRKELAAARSTIAAAELLH